MKKLTLFFAAIFTIALNNIYAQITFQKTYGGTGYDEGTSVQQTSDGGYIVTGYTTSFGNGNDDAYLIKTNSFGDTLWTKTFGGTEGDKGNSVQQTSDGGYIITGYTASFGAGFSDVYLIKTDANGDTLWTKTFGGANFDTGISLQQTNDGGYVIVGITSSFGAGNRDVYLIKTNNLGDTLWTKTFGGIGSDFGSSVQQTSDGGYVILGKTNSFGAGSSDIYLIKTNNLGDTLWTKIFGVLGDDYGNSVQQTIDGGYIIMTNGGDPGALTTYLIKTNDIGDTLWTNFIGNSYIGTSMQQTNDGGYIIAGWIYNVVNNYNVCLLKTDSGGNIIGINIFGETGLEKGNSVQKTNDGGYIITGYTTSFGAGYHHNVYLIKTDSSGASDISIGIKDKTKNALKVNAFPNPTNNKLYISIAYQENQPIQYQINNTLGATIITNKATTKEFNIDVSTLPTGIYFIHLQSGNAQTVKRFVKE